MTNALTETLTCLIKGIRDGLRPKLLLASLLIWLASIALVATAFIGFRAELFDFFMKTSGFLASGAGLLTPSSGDGVSSWIGRFGVADAAGAGVQYATRGFSVFLMCVSFLLAVFLLVRLIIEFTLIDRIKAVVKPSYPEVSAAAGLPLRDQLRHAARVWIIGITGLVLLLLPVAGGPLYFLLAAYLGVRSLVVEVLEDTTSPSELQAIARTSRWRMLLLGVLSAAVVLIPVLGFFAPSIIGASICHFSYRRLSSIRAND